MPLGKLKLAHPFTTVGWTHAFTGDKKLATILRRFGKIVVNFADVFLGRGGGGIFNYQQLSMRRGHSYTRGVYPQPHVN